MRGQKCHCDGFLQHCKTCGGTGYVAADSEAPPIPLGALATELMRYVDSSPANSAEHRYTARAKFVSDVIVESAITSAEQACRYALKHQTFEAGDDGKITDYESGWTVAAAVCEGAIRSQVYNHLMNDICHHLAAPEASKK